MSNIKIVLFIYSSPYVFDSHALAFYYQSFSSKVPCLRVSWSRILGPRIPSPRVRSQSLGSRVSGPDFRLCHLKVSIEKKNFSKLRFPRFIKFFTRSVLGSFNRRKYHQILNFFFAT